MLEKGRVRFDGVEEATVDVENVDRVAIRAAGRKVSIFWEFRNENGEMNG